MKKFLSLLTLLLVVCSGAWADSASLNALSTGTTNFSTSTTGYHEWKGTKTKNIVIYDQATTPYYLMGWSNGNDLGQDATGLKFGNSSKKSAFVFKTDVTADISVGIARNGSDMTASLYYLGTTTDVLTDPNNMSPTGALSSVAISSSSSSGTLTKSGAAAGYYMVFGTLRFYATSITITASETYTVTYKAGEGTGDDVVDATAATVADCPDTFTAPDGKAFAGWNTASDGTGTAYTVGASVTTNLTLYAQWATAYSVTYDANGANSGTAPTDNNAPYVAGATVTVLGNTGSLAKSGYGFGGWNTESDGSGTSYSAENTFTMPSSNVTLYAEWVAYDYIFTPKTVTSDEEISNGAEIETSTGGKMTKDGGTIKYTTSGLSFESSSSSVVTVTLDKLMQVGTVITGTLYYGSKNDDRTLYLRNSSSSTNQATWRLDATEDTKSQTFTYTVTSTDGLANTKAFKLARKNNVYLTSLTVANCVQPVTVTATKEYSTFCSAYDLDFSNVSNLEAYTVSAINSNSASISKVNAAPAGTGLILKKTANVGTESNFSIPVIASAAAVGTNHLVGVLADTDMTSVANAYILSNGLFYECSGGTLAAGEAYLVAAAWASSGARSFSLIIDDEPTGIDNVNLNANDNGCFDLQGRRVASPQKGLYIINGKKVVIR